MQLRSPGSKEPMLLQKIPASYIALEDIVNVIACNLRAAGRDPVLDGEQYKRLVTEQMRLHNYKSFRDAAELQQATTWCHENGVLLHYDDATLRTTTFSIHSGFATCWPMWSPCGRSTPLLLRA